MAIAATQTYSSHSHSLFGQPQEMATTSSFQQVQHAQQQQHEHDPNALEEQFATLFCRALYEYDAQDASALSFRRGDIIEVLTQQPSGWWDGLLGDERGWFPSNYVEVISDEEAESAFAAIDSMGQEGAMSDNDPSSTLHISQSMSRGMGPTENEDWSDNEVIYSNAGPNTFSHKSTSSDFWMPQVTPDGQIYYVNTQTGQRSRDLPQEADDDISDSELAGLASQSSSRSGTSTGLAFGLKPPSELSNSMQDAAGFGVFRRTGTPEPWVRKLADDGRSYYYHNKNDGRIQRTRPEGPRETTSPPIEKSSSQSSSKSSSSTSLSRLTNGNNRHSMYSDDSGVQPLNHLRPSRDGEAGGLRERAQKQVAKPGPTADYTTAERIARSLQQILTPSAPELVTELSAVAKSAIQAVVNNVRLNGLARRPEEDKLMDDLINNVVLAVRNLLYVSAVQTGLIPSDVLPQEARGLSNPPSQSPLKPAQRKVTATLSRLVLSARAMQYDAGSLMADTLHRIELDAEELDKAVFSFMLDVQRTQHGSPNEQRPSKRLYGVFGVSHLGLGLVGAGAAGWWKGFGWVPLDQGQASVRKVLGPQIVSELKSNLATLEEQSRLFVHAMQTPADGPAEELQALGMDVVSQISAILVSVSDIHVARHIDIDGYRQEGGSSDEHYSRTVENARLLVRSLETVVQSLFDDSSSLFLTLQSVRDYRQDRIQCYDHLEALCASMTSNSAFLFHTLDSLLSLGHDQAEMAQGDYNGSIEWRMSMVSLRPISGFSLPVAQSTNVVDLGQAFGSQDTKPKAELYHSPYNDHDRIANSVASHTVDSSRDFETTEGTFTGNGGDSVSTGTTQQADQVTLFDDDAIISPKSATRPGGSSKLEKSKLEKILGDEYADKVAADVAADLKPWYLRTTYNPQEILIDNDGSVRGGTVAALVERLTAHDQTDRAFIDAFLMTFKSFTTLDELFDLLVARFRIQPPPKLTPIEREEWGKLKQHVIQMRVINTFKSMITDDDVLEKEDYYILDRIRAFANSDEMGPFAAAKILVSHIDSVKGGDNPKMAISSQAPPPPPILPKTNKGKLKLGDIEPLELARQLTIMESLLYQKIKPMECLQRAREQKLENADNITTVIQTSNRIADWVADLVLSKEDPRRRAAIVKQLIMIADRCRTMNNFSTMIAITSGLNTPPIRRLKRTWEQVNQRTMAQFTACEMTIDSNKTFTKYRQLMSSVTPPCVPFIGVFLSTLQFIQDGNPDSLSGNLINFRKRQKAFEVINDIKQWQAHPYNFQLVPIIQHYIEESLNRYNDTRASSEHFWELSLAREPREREDEKMARLLQESGFI